MASAFKFFKPKKVEKIKKGTLIIKIPFTFRDPIFEKVKPFSKKIEEKKIKAYKVIDKNKFKNWLAELGGKEKYKTLSKQIGKAFDKHKQKCEKLDIEIQRIGIIPSIMFKKA